MNILKCLRSWEKCKKPAWINTKGWDYYSVHIIKGKHYEYQLVGSFSGKDVDQCYRRKI